MAPRFLQKSTKNGEQSFVCNCFEAFNNNGHFHYHKEFEISFVVENAGTRLIGDSVESFNNNDLVLVGADLPHCWQSNKEGGENRRSIVIHFEQDFLGADFFNIPEMQKVKNMLSHADRGLYFKEEDAKRLKCRFVDILNKENWLQVIDLLLILCEMAECEYVQLTSEGFLGSASQLSDEKRIDSIYNYLVQNYNKDIRLEDVANVANMSPAAFCRYFKKVTSKTFTDSMNIIRISTACKKLINTELTISEIGYDCGYQTISYFNRQFKKVKKISPSAYRMKYMIPDILVSA